MGSSRGSRSSILLLGPHRAGKSTVGKLLAEELGRPLLHLAVIAERYRDEIGYDEAAMRRSWERGWDGFYHYMQPFEAHGIERALPELEECILELDSRQAAFDDPPLLERVQRALQPYPHVVLLLPSPDIEESLRVIAERQTVAVNGMPINAHFVKHHSNHDLAKHVVYTKGKTPEETCEEILARIDPSAGETILIGPIRAGKSTQGKLLAERLKVRQVSMDALRWQYYQEVGWSREEEQRIMSEEGFGGVYRYWKRFEVHAVGRLLAERRNCVIDFGAGHSVYEDDAQFARVQEHLAPYPNVVLLLPSPDLDESVAILDARDRFTIGGTDLNRFFTTHMMKLARQVVYTEQQTPEETAREIMRRCALA